MDDEVVERFSPTSGRITGIIVLVMVAAIPLADVFDRSFGFAAPVVAGALTVGVLAWAAMLRPRVWVTRQHLVLRNMFETISVPLAAIEEIAVRQVLTVQAGDDRHVSPALGRSRRQARKSSRPGAQTGAQTGNAQASLSYPDFVEGQIRQYADDARAQLGVARYSDEQVALAAGTVRRPAWIELGALGVTLVAFVVTLIL